MTNIRFHYVGCSEWARAWLRRWGHPNLDARTLSNLEDMIKKGRAACCASES